MPISNPPNSTTIVSTTPPPNPIPNVTRWWNPNGQMEWFWNGTYWLSSATQYLRFGSHGNSVTTSKYEPLETEFSQYNIYCLSWNVAARIDTTNNATNYWHFEIYRRSSTLTVTLISSVNTSSWSPGAIVVQKNPINMHLNIIGGLDAKTFWVYMQKIGTPGIVDPLTVALAYKLARF